MIATVHYGVGTYSGEITVNAADNEDDDEIISRAREALRRRCGGWLPFGSTSFQIVDRGERTVKP